MVSTGYVSLVLVQCRLWASCVCMCVVCGMCVVCVLCVQCVCGVCGMCVVCVVCVVCSVCSVCGVGYLYSLVAHCQKPPIWSS